MPNTVSDLKDLPAKNFNVKTSLQLTEPFYCSMLNAWNSIRFRTQSYQDIIRQPIWENQNILIEKKPIKTRSGRKQG